ncbi:MAG: hypothetical protein ABI596_05955 [Pyrinomonadaceae bacterium]
MFHKKITIGQVLPAALVILSAAIFTCAQTNPSPNQSRKQNDRPPAVVPSVETPEGEPEKGEPAQYSYDFSQPQFYLHHIVVEHDVNGNGRVVVERRGEDTPIIEPLKLSPVALGRIASLWQTLRFLDSEESYQSDKQYPHLGTVRLKMKQGTRQRTAEFNWTRHREASALANEYRRAADQAMFIFDITMAREMRPLDAPQLMQQLDMLLSRDGLSDPQQILPLIRELSTDERIPLIARNHATRILKKMQK